MNTPLHVLLFRPRMALLWVALVGLVLSTFHAAAQCGGVINFLSPGASSSNSTSVQVYLCPSNAVLAGAKWGLLGDPPSSYSSVPGYYREITNYSGAIAFNTNVPGWDP